MPQAEAKDWGKGENSARMDGLGLGALRFGFGGCVRALQTLATALQRSACSRQLAPAKEPKPCRKWIDPVCRPQNGPHHSANAGITSNCTEYRGDSQGQHTHAELQSSFPALSDDAEGPWCPSSALHPTRSYQEPCGKWANVHL